MIWLNFEKIYDYNRGIIETIEFNYQPLNQVKILYINSWHSIGLNKFNSEPFKFIRSIFQDCVLALFFFLFIGNYLSYLLESNKGVIKLKLLEIHSKIFNQEIVDDFFFVPIS